MVKYLALLIYILGIVAIIFANQLGQQVTVWGQVIACAIWSVFGIPMLWSVFSLPKLWSVFGIPKFW